MNVDAYHPPPDDRPGPATDAAPDTRRKPETGGEHDTGHGIDAPTTASSRATSEPVTGFPARGPTDLQGRDRDNPTAAVAESGAAADSQPPSAVPATPDRGPAPHPTPSAELAESADSTPELPARERILVAADARSREQLDEVCAMHGLDTPEQVAALAKAQQVLDTTLVPFTVEAGLRARENLRREVAEHPDTVVAVVHRDGAGLGKVLDQIDPELSRAHCRPVFLSRKTMEEVLQDLEKNAGRTFPELEPFRDRSRADPARIDGAALRTQRHLLQSGIPITTPGARIITLDSGHKGSIQEYLTAAYSKPHYSGQFIFHVQSEDDPHKGTKTGLMLHQSPDRIDPADPDDPAHIYADKDPAVVIEHLLHGTMSTTRGHDDHGNPDHSVETPPIDPIHPRALAPEYADRAVRSAIVDLAQRSIANQARTVAELDAAGIDYRAGLAEQARLCTLLVRSWAYGNEPGDPAFNALADSFVPRGDKHLVARLRIATTGLGDAATTAIWNGYQDLSSTDKERYVTHLEHTAPPPGSVTPEGNPHG